MEQIFQVEFPIKVAWGVVSNDKAVHLVATLDELRRIAIMQDWAARHLLLVHFEVLLGEYCLSAFLSLLGNVTPSAQGVVPDPLLHSSKKQR